MIEIIQESGKKDPEGTNKLPKNIRQIGNPEKDFRIYMEDYVYTYLHPAREFMAEEERNGRRVVILLGEIETFAARKCAFISGAIQAETESEDFCQHFPELTEAGWQFVTEEIQKYFKKSDIIGWVLDVPGGELRLTKEIEQIHKRYFRGKDQFLFLMDQSEREEAFYIQKLGQLTKKEGYFIYYEKNPQMQEYMISRREKKTQTKTEEVNDHAAQNYRALMLEKKGEQALPKKFHFAMYSTPFLLVFTLCAICLIGVGGLKKVQNMEHAITMLTMAESSEEEQPESMNQVAVEAISGNVLPIQQQENNEAQVQEEIKEESVPAQPEEITDTAEQPPAVNSEESAEEVQTPQENIPPQESGEKKEDHNQAEEESKQQEAPPQNTENAPQEKKDEVQTWREQGYYIVQPGDSLQQISYRIYKTYAMTDKLCELNGIEDVDTIFAGQKLILP